MTFKSVFKKTGSIVCRALLDALQSEGRFNLTKIGLLVLTFALYSLLLTWKFAILLMLAIGWHEAGHVWAMRRVGVDTKGFYFVPFFGGVAISGTNYKSNVDRVIVFIMGPVWGTLMALGTLALYWITGSPILGAAAYWQGILNLFNLIPANPLDGGQIFSAIFNSVNKRVGQVFSALSVLAFIGMAIKLHSAVFIFAAVLATLHFVAQLKSKVYDGLPKLSAKQIFLTLAAHTGVALVLASIVGLTLEPGKRFVELFLK